MELHEKLQGLRKQRGMTQEELSELLHVSRTAISKWKSGRGYPSIDSLKAISQYFQVSLDELLSGDTLLFIAEEDRKQKEDQFRSLVFGWVDCSHGLLLFLPFFAQRERGLVRAVSLFAFTGTTSYVKEIYFAVVLAVVLHGVILFAMQNCRRPIWQRSKEWISLGLSAVGVLAFLCGLQAYAAVFAFVFLAVKVFVLIKTR